MFVKHMFVWWPNRQTWQAKFQMFAKQCLSVWPGLKVSETLTSKTYLSSQAMFVVVAKHRTMLGKQISKCLSSSTCTFGRGFSIWLPKMLDKHIFLVNQKYFRLVTSKNCFSSTCLCDKHFSWQIFEVLLVKRNVCQFGHYLNTCLTNIFACESLTSEMYLSSNACRGGQTHDKQNSKCLPNNVFPFGRGLRLYKFL